MTIPKDEIQSQLNDAWMQNFDSLEKSVDLLENYIKEAKGTPGICTDDWGEATKQIMHDLNNALFPINEPRTKEKQDEYSRRCCIGKSCPGENRGSKYNIFGYKITDNQYLYR